MRILLDCRTLSTGPPSGEKRLFIHSCAAILAKNQGVKWVFLVDRRHPGTLPAEIGLSLPVSRTMPGPVGRWIWINWRLPRIVKKFEPDLAITVEEITRIPGAADERYRSLPGEEKEEIKKRFAEGKEYFLADVAGARPKEIVGLLKAFSLFKKRQRSNMQLVLGRVGPVRGWGIDLVGKLATYKYRADVHLCDSPGEDEWGRLVGAAYAFITPLGRETLGLAMLNAWKAETPVIATDAPSLQSLGEEAALYPAPGDPASLAGLLMSLYTNEGLRAELIGKAASRVRTFSWERSAGQVWEGILRATNKQ